MSFRPKTSAPAPVYNGGTARLTEVLRLGAMCKDAKDTEVLRLGANRKDAEDTEVLLVRKDMSEAKFAENTLDTGAHWPNSKAVITLKEKSTAKALKEFTITVLNCTMGEGFNLCTPSTEELNVILPTFKVQNSLRKTLYTGIGPFALARPIELSHLDPPYLWTTLPCILKYLERSVMIGVRGTMCFAHGGVSKIRTPDEQERFFENLEFIRTTDHLQTVNVNEMKHGAYTGPTNSHVRLKERGAIHKLAVATGDSTINGRMYVWEPCYINWRPSVEAHLPHGMNFIANGHTPQWSGFPMIASVPNGHVIVLDTQFTDRMSNNHALMTNPNGSFILQGSWKHPTRKITIKYVAESEDSLIGTQMFLRNEQGNGKHCFRVICKIVERTDGVATTTPQEQYIAVRYKPKGIDDPAESGPYTDYTDEQRFNFQQPGETELIVFAKNKEPTIVEMLKGTMPPVGTTLKTESKGEELQLKFTYNAADRPVIFCGDIEASVPFLRAFLEHALSIARTVCPVVDMNIADGAQLKPVDEYKYEEFGIDGSKLIRESKDVEAILMNTAKLEKLVNIGCIGDVAGDPNGGGNDDNKHFLNEFVCVHWAAYLANESFCATGNREANKWRLLDEIPAFLDTGYLADEDALSEYANHTRNVSETQEDFTERVGKLKARANAALVMSVYPKYYEPKFTVPFGHCKGTYDGVLLSTDLEPDDVIAIKLLAPKLIGVPTLVVVGQGPDDKCKMAMQMLSAYGVGDTAHIVQGSTSGAKYPINLMRVFAESATAADSPQIQAGADAAALTSAFLTECKAPLAVLLKPPHELKGVDASLLGKTAAIGYGSFNWTQFRTALGDELSDGERFARQEAMMHSFSRAVWVERSMSVGRDSVLEPSVAPILFGWFQRDAPLMEMVLSWSNMTFEECVRKIKKLSVAKDLHTTKANTKWMNSALSEMQDATRTVEGYIKPTQSESRNFTPSETTEYFRLAKVGEKVSEELHNAVTKYLTGNWESKDVQSMCDGIGFFWENTMKDMRINSLTYNSVGFSATDGNNFRTERETALTMMRENFEYLQFNVLDKKVKTMNERVEKMTSIDKYEDERIEKVRKVLDATDKKVQMMKSIARYKGLQSPHADSLVVALLLDKNGDLSKYQKPIEHSNVAVLYAKKDDQRDLEATSMEVLTSAMSDPRARATLP